MNNNESLYIIVPAYNEAENIEEFVKEWYPVVEKYSASGKSRLVIVNDGSKDNTYELLLSLQKTHPLLKPLTKENGGHGSTLLFGYQYAISNNADYVFQTDSDGQTRPNEFDDFWNLRKDYSAVFGHRNKRKDGFSRVIVEKVLCLVLYCVFKEKVPDANAPFRLFRTDRLKKYISMLPENYNLPNAVLTVLYQAHKEPICFREITFRSRQGGKNSINLRKIFRIGMKAIGDFRSIKRNISA